LEEDEVDERMVRLESDVAHMRSDISDIKTDIRELRAELKADSNGLRTESSATKEVLGGVRFEIANLRDEMRSGHERLHRLIIRTSLLDRIWMLLLTGTMLAVMAHGFKWI
jgi:predicted RNase H-like nuclease (RuvC/YqgF family)